MTSENDKIQPGEWVAIQRENYIKVHKVSDSAVAMLGRECVELSSLVNQPKWGTYAMQEKGSNKSRKFTLSPCESALFEENAADDLVDEIVLGKDNRNIRDDGTSQKLSKEEIEGMQAEGASAKQIIGQLIENSSTFDQKTAYSKEKYVKKKEKKYKRVILVRPTSIRLIYQALVGPSLESNKILGLRLDSLAQLVYHSGVQAGGGVSTFILFDSGSQALVTAAMLERLGHDSGAHLIVVGATRGTNKAVAVQAMNFPPTQLEKVHYVTLNKLLAKAKENGLILGDAESKKIPLENAAVDAKNVAESMEIDKILPFKDSPITDEDDKIEPEEGKKEGLKREGSQLQVESSKRPLSDEDHTVRTCVERLKERRAVCLVVAGKEDPCEVTSSLLPLVEWSRPVAIFSQFREPLQEAYIKLKGKGVTALRFTEPWLREYQMLPERTRPENSMSGSGGYILTGITVDPVHTV